MQFNNNNLANNKLELLINKFIKKVINDDKNYNLIKNISNKNINSQNIKLVNIFFENNNINKISTEKLIINFTILTR